ncbi:SMP-30/gluconolactonase/LRE family protein [Paenalkalicoccus suaedae]|uniref:SMP-30/gluconolactonase/LRE family protein n=1 Tax=Paenalkalicoccus suaedae TaxID=2592382 RepID=A0A859FA93_9BACI|nr:SMP-30/gluconolactonase/LRE family protein [Paenalkalicoccus suaedae]QKS69708.1 SMP-30/gluconolactonase/LRE family protein [Paenalkalicoccus suaedae]
MGKAELLYDAKAKLAEGPVWDEDNEQLMWVDIEGKTVNFLDPSGKNEEHSLEQRVGCAVRGMSGDVYVGLDNGLYRYELESKKLHSIHDPEEDKPGNRFNDGKCDPKGRFYAGTMVLDGDDGDAALYCLSGGKVSTVVTGATISNGLAWDERKEVFYYIDTPTHEIRRYPYDVEAGTLGEPEVVFTAPDDFGHPDGMTIDDEGKLWVAFFDGGCVRRICPDDQKVLETVDVAATNVTSCCFGGKNMDVLYITTGREGKSDEELEQEPHAGGIFTYSPGVTGAKSYRYDDRA